MMLLGDIGGDVVVEYTEYTIDGIKRNGNT